MELWKRPGRGRGGGVRRKVCCQIGAGRIEREEGGVTLVQRLLDGAAGGRERDTLRRGPGGHSGL